MPFFNELKEINSKFDKKLLFLYENTKFSKEFVIEIENKFNKTTQIFKNSNEILCDMSNLLKNNYKEYKNSEFIKNDTSKNFENFINFLEYLQIVCNRDIKINHCSNSCITKIIRYLLQFWALCFAYYKIYFKNLIKQISSAIPLKSVVLPCLKSSQTRPSLRLNSNQVLLSSPSHKLSSQLALKIPKQL